ncbi:MAG: 3-hydroxyacyl-CoA dehydrogenase/3-hydroxy-2-methylbutyryl-CoA dehydrogenase [Cryomorphaceae bacterium]|jgi:3-hydroxyacyl-CoA dehydrogenase/3-hydroxy-2-methylbutyryl-CoA dehydrogenase
MQLDNKVAVITGGASGLGEATTRRFVEQGAKVAIFDLNDERGNALSEELGDAVIYQNVDVVSEDSVEAGIAATIAAFGAVHINCNFAGIGHAEKTVGRENQPHALDSYRRVIEINLIGTFNVLRLCAAQMSKQESLNDDGCRGIIINTASVAGSEGQIGQAAYAATKGAIIGSTICMARDLAQLGIRVNTIVPGLIHTPMFDSIPENIYQSLESSVLYPQRLGKPDEIAQLAQYFVENDYMNGECVRMDGGIRMQAR